jgi:hypothetical protein
VDVGTLFVRAVNDWEDSELDAAMLHACNAVDGTAAKMSPTSKSSNARFTRLLRENYSILGPMGAPGLNLEATRFPVRVEHPKALGGQPDIVDVIYGIHRCHHGHGIALPDGFELISDAAGTRGYTRIEVKREGSA